MPASPIERRACLAVLASLALATAPSRVRAAPPVDASEEPSAEPSSEPAEGPREPEPEPSSPSEAELTPEPEVTTVEQPEGPAGGGVAGAVVDPDDPNASRAQSDLEGEELDTTLAGVPERLPELQAAGWWMTFTAVALATTGGIFAGIAETREDETERLAYSFDLATGRTTTYGPVADEYERLVDQGNTYQWVARGFLIAGGVALLAGITLFAVDGVRQRRAARSDGSTAARPGPRSRPVRVRVDPGAGGLTLRF